jgi:hypothetical protein
MGGGISEKMATFSVTAFLRSWRPPLQKSTVGIGLRFSKFLIYSMKMKKIQPKGAMAQVAQR